MPLFKARARPRLTRLSTSSSSSFRKKERQIYICILAVALLLIASVSILQFSIGRTSAHTAHDAKDTRKRGSGVEDLHVNRQKGEAGTALRQEKLIDTEKALIKKRAETFDSGNLSRDWKTRSAVKREVGNGLIEEGKEVGSKEKEAHFIADFDGREIVLDDEEMDDSEFGSGGEEFNEERENPRVFQGQQLEDMDRFDSEVTEGTYKHEEQLLEEMEKFDKSQVMEDSNSHQVENDAVPEFTQDLGDLRGLELNRKYQMVSRHRAEKLAKGSSLVNENDTRVHTQDGKKESRKLGYRGDNGRDMLNKEKEGEEQSNLDKLGRSVSDQLGSEDRIQSANAITWTSGAAKGSIRAAIEQEIKKRSSVISREKFMDVRGRSEEEAGNPLIFNLEETNPNPDALHVKNVEEKQNLGKGVGIGMPPTPLRGFNEFSDDMKVSHDIDDEHLENNVLQKDVKSEDAVVLDEGRSQASKFGLSSWDIQKMREAGIVDPLNLSNAKENKGDIKLLSRSAQKTAEVHNPDSVKLSALATEERTSNNKKFDQIENLKLNVEISKAQGHLESADVLHSEKQLIKEGQLDNVEDSKNEIEVKVESRETNEEVSSAEENEDDEHDNLIQWGFYPTLSPTLKFSKFLSAFFKKEDCTLRIFMAWTTAPWAYTPRHQRVIESILHFHPHACIVVFTETIDFQFFDSWVKEGYKIAVSRPNLEELLGQTPAIDFANVWYEWRNMKLFYIHYTELLRITALHKYGGVWLDMDMILARPLPTIHNVLGSTVAENGEWFLNGAFMSFDKSSSFLEACIEEFVATYDETSLGWNGADLLNRVASNATIGGKVWLEEPDHLQVLEPIGFFPLSRHDITRYFSAPKNYHEKVEQKKMLTAILDESHGTHLWNSVTGRYVPEVGSLVEKLLNQFCIRCTDIL